jgi:multicomponent Na+:H+ antiporter subunit E
MFDAFHMSLGVISCVLVTFMSHDLFFKERFTSRNIAEFFRFIIYIPWLLYQILLSNIHVAYLVLHPKMPIAPSMVKLGTRLKKDLALVTYANSIILTPGTITMDIVDRKYFLIHCISKKVADDLYAGDMEKRIAHIFDDKGYKEA